MLDVEFYRLYNGLQAGDLTQCLCRENKKFELTLMRRAKAYSSFRFSSLAENWGVHS